jgi:hypothetical protein
MRETKKNHKIDFDLIREHEHRMRELSETRRHEEEMRMKEEAKVNVRIVNILERFKEKFKPADPESLKKSLKIEMLKKQHDFAEQVT